MYNILLKSMRIQTEASRTELDSLNKVEILKSALTVQFNSQKYLSADVCEISREMSLATGRE